MKKILLLTATLIAFAFIIPDDAISKKERKSVQTHFSDGSRETVL